MVWGSELFVGHVRGGGGFRSQADLGQHHKAPLAGCVVLGKSLCFSEPPFFHLKARNHSIATPYRQPGDHTASPPRTWCEP